MLTIITTWYNERLLAPLFLSHYAGHRIIVMLDGDTNDETLDYLSVSRAEVVHFLNVEGWDAFDHAKRQMDVYRTIKDGWVLFVDADEFVFPLPELKDEVYCVNFAQVFRNETEGDIDYSLPAMY